jgi:hypothetical protein
MRNFFKTFAACLLALVLFTVLVFFFIIGYVGGLAYKSVPKIKDNSVLVLDLGKHYAEQVQNNPFAAFQGMDKDIPALYDVVRLLHEAKNDT